MKNHERAVAEGWLFTDQYQLTMAQLYFKLGLHNMRAQFDYFFRRYPDYGGHQAGYCINAGLDWLLDWLEESQITPRDVELLASQRGRQGAPVFQPDFLDWLLANGNYRGISIAAVPEGRVVHPNIPLAVVQGPLAAAQILETPLLNHLNFQTLIATKAARIRESGRGQVMLEFGMRRAQGRAATAGVRAALIGGADFSSNVGASHIFGFSPKGTHAHSMVQAFMALGEGELGAFRHYADLYPDDCLLLVDTIDTLNSGVPNAIKVFEELRRTGHVPVGIRLDSGDLAYLSIQAAKQLDAAGFPHTSITLSNQLDEIVIWQILTQIETEAPRYGVDPDTLIRRLIFGVGTRLISSHGQPALDGVYKLTAVEQAHNWTPAIKISETPSKTLNPGHKGVWRLYDQRGNATADAMSLDTEQLDVSAHLLLRHPTDHAKTRMFAPGELSRIEPLLHEVLRDGKPLRPREELAQIRARRGEDLERLDPGVRRLVNPHIYHVSLTEGLWELKQNLIKAARSS